MYRGLSILKWNTRSLDGLMTDYSAHKSDSGTQRPCVVMLLTNPFTHDTRVDTQARTLVEWGYDVHIVCLAKQNLAMRECIEGLTVHRVEIRARSIPRVLQGILRMSDSERIGAWLDEPLDEPLDDSSASATGLAGPGFWSRLGERGGTVSPGGIRSDRVE